MRTKCCSLVLTLFVALSARAGENVNQVKRHAEVHMLANCSPSTSYADLDIGNVRARILMNGDMWSDLNGNPEYEVPKNSGKYSLYAGAFWIGGTDAGNNLKLAAQTYRQNGSDFWPGPLDTATATVSASVCAQYSRHWKITRHEVQAFVDSLQPGHTPITPSQDIRQWPGNGDLSVGQEQFLAPFVDANADGIYNWTDGDYPAYDFTMSGSCNLCNFLHGDQTIWWVFNDMGNVHGETGGSAIGLEIRAQAFAFNSGIPNLDNATFYQYKIINRSTVSLNNAYLGIWVDPDLGNYLDDYVGCDVARGMGYCYNGDPDDDGAAGYGLNPPAVGVDFLLGPNADIGDGIDNDRDSCTDCTYIDSSGQIIAVPETVLPELIKMSKFVYYNNDVSLFGNPLSALDYYNYMRGIWKNGNPVTYGGNGHGGGSGATNDTCDFMFPGDSDPNHWGAGGRPEAVWDETSAGNAPGDRRFLQSAGPFTMLPGSVTCITTAAIWARAASGGPLASVVQLKQADDEIQQYFNSCFTTFPVSTNELTTALSATVYPNPFQDYTTISFPFNSKPSPVDVVLYNGNGEMVRTYHHITGHKLAIKRESLSSGIYFYRISGDGNNVTSGKLVIID